MSDPKLNTPSSSEMQIDNLQSNDFSLLNFFKVMQGYASDAIFNIFINLVLGNNI